MDTEKEKNEAPEKGKGTSAAPPAGKAKERQNNDAAAPTVRIRWDDSKMKSVYSNVCNVSTGREEFVLFFGLNQAWRAGQQEIPVQLSDRIVMSPHAVKRLATLLGNVVRDYESRYGSL